jgi:hypothetical protein
VANKLYVAEYANVLGSSGTQQGEALPGAPLATQVVTIAAAPGNNSVAFNSRTRMIAVTSDTACCINVGALAGLVAAATNLYIPANGLPVKISVTPDMGIAACTP